jgi:hypothetical protein
VTLHAAAALVALGEKQDPEILIAAMGNPKANHALAMQALLKIEDDGVFEWLINWLARVDPAAAQIGPEQYKEIKQRVISQGARALPLLDTAIKRSGGTLIDELKGIRTAILSAMSEKK